MTTNADLLRQDAGNRALRTFVQGLAIDVVVAVSLVVYEATAEESPDWRLLWASLVKTAVHAVASGLMRLKAGGMLAPPAPQAQPAVYPPEDAAP